MSVHVDVLVHQRKAHKALMDRKLSSGWVDPAEDGVIMDHGGSLGHVGSEVHDLRRPMVDFDVVQNQIVQEGMRNAPEEDPRICSDVIPR